jgi:hypothetical protein
MSVATAMTIIISTSVSSQAAIFPAVIITPNDGRPPLAVFGESRESYGIGCAELDRLWTGTPRRSVDADGYNKAIGDSIIRFAGNLKCNGGFYEGYTSPALPGGNILIFTHQDGRKYRHSVTADSFRALRVNPRQISSLEARLILKRFPPAQTNFQPGHNPPLEECLTCSTKPTPAPKLSVPFLVPNRILTTKAGNYPPMAMFDGRDESYLFDPACPGMNALWGSIRREAVSSEQFGKVLTSPNFVGGLACNVPPGFNQGYSSPDIPGGHMLVLRHRDGIRYRHFVNTPDFFGALQLTPKQLSPQELETILKEVPPAKTHFTKSS